MSPVPVPLSEALGVRPWPERWRQALVALRGEEHVPATRFGVSSLRQLRPRFSIPLWRGRTPVDRKVLISNLFNHTPTPIDGGWSVRRTQVRDFRGKGLTYDSHNGTDFCVPIGTVVLAPAPGQVVRVANEFNRGGLKIFVDHGLGLMTNCAHLARSLVKVGQIVGRGDPIALSGYSGLDGLVTFPWGVPHVHFNVWLNGDPIDPFPHDERPSMWVTGDRPEPPAGIQTETLAPSIYRPEGVDAAIAACRTAAVRDRLAAVEPLAMRAGETLAEMNYYPTRFSARPQIYTETYARSPRLDLPFSFDDFNGVAFVDEV